jgi:predicted nucleic acid-binding protein
MSLGDALIAGTALSHDLRLATHNTDDFTWIDDLAVFDPIEEDE